MCASEQSDRPIVPEKPSNKVPSIIANDHGAAEMVEERCLTKGNLLKFDRCRTLRRRLDMENTKRVRKEKFRIRLSGDIYVEPKDL